MRRSIALGSLAIAVWLGLCMQRPVQAQSTGQWESTRFLPPDVSIVIDLRDLGSRWREIEGSSVFQKLMANPGIQDALASKQFQNARKGQQFIEGLFAKPLVDLVQDLTQEGATLAWKSEREVAMLIKPASDTFDRLKQTLKEFTTATALGKSNDDQGQLFATTYRGVDAYGINKARIAFCNDWVVVCSTNEIGKNILDRILGDNSDSLAEEKWFRQATDLANSKSPGATPAVTALFDLNRLREEGKLRIPRGADPGQEIIFGGAFDAAEKSPVAVALALIDGKSAHVQVAALREPDSDELRDYFFGQEQLQSAPSPIDIPNRILSGRWHRDFGLFWKMAPQIIHDENALAGIAKAESDISTMLGGMVTVSELFQYLGPEVEFVAVQAAQSSADGPSLPIPAFAVTGSLRNAAKAQPAFRLAFQQVVSFANLNASSGMYPPLEVTTEKEGGKTLISGSYFAMDQEMMTDRPGGDVYKNFTPSLGFIGDRFVLASQRLLAEQILATDPPKQTETRTTAGVDNTVLELWPMELAAAGERAREMIIGQRLLTTGKNRESAEAEVDLLVAVLRQIASVRLGLQADEKSLVVEFEMRLAEPSNRP